MFPREEKGWDPHGSVHADGTHHHESFDHKFHVQPGEKPDAEIQVTPNVVTTGIASGEAHAINTPCKADKFSALFEIPEVAFRSEKYRTCIGGSGE